MYSMCNKLNKRRVQLRSRKKVEAGEMKGREGFILGWHHESGGEGEEAKRGQWSRTDDTPPPPGHVCINGGRNPASVTWRAGWQTRERRHKDVG